MLKLGLSLINTVAPSSGVPAPSYQEWTGYSDSPFSGLGTVFFAKTT